MSYAPVVRVREVRGDGEPLQALSARQVRTYKEARADVWGLGSVPAAGRFMVMVAGAPGSGKTCYSYMVGQSWIRSRGESVLFVSAEEGVSESVGARLRWLEIAEERIFIVPGCAPCDALSTARAHDVGLLILDSWSVAGWSLTDLAQLRDSFSILFVVHLTKQDDPAGPRYLEHYVDQVVRIENGRFEHTKNRFGDLQSGRVFGADLDGV